MLLKEKRIDALTLFDKVADSNSHILLLTVSLFKWESTRVHLLPYGREQQGC